MEKDLFVKDQFILQLQNVSTQQIFELINQMQLNKLIEFIEPNFIKLIKLHTADEFFSSQWSINNQGYLGGTPGADMHVEDAWNYSTGQNIKIAIIDEGVDLGHPDLAANILTGYDATGNGSGGAPSNNDAHGTACAGIVAAVANNTIGIAGIAYNAKIIPIRIARSSSNQPWTSDTWCANGITWAKNNGADILSNSWGGGSPSTAITNAINDAVNNGRDNGTVKKGCVVLFSTGNHNTSLAYPSTLSNVIAVGASSMCDTRKRSSSNPALVNSGVSTDPLDVSCDGETWWGSNFGNGLDVLAPGVNIFSTDILGINGYESGNYIGDFNGTSSACPNASGVMALILSTNPNLTGLQARNILESTCDKIGGYAYQSGISGQPNGTWSTNAGYGRVNACAAVAMAKNTLTPATISGSSSNCASQQYTVNNLPSGATVFWKRTPTNSTTLTQANNVATLNKLTDGLVVLTAEITICGYAFTITKTINVGNPYTQWNVNGCTYTEAQTADDPSEGPCNVQCYSPSISKWWCAQPVYNATNVTWQKVWSIPSNYNFWSGSWSGNNNHVNILFKGQNQQVVLKTTISNPCGYIEQYYCFTSNNVLCSSNYRTAECNQFDVSFMGNTQHIKIKEKEQKCDGQSINQLQLIQIVDKIGNIVSEQKINEKQTLYELDLSKAKNDIYFVLLQYDNTIETHQIGVFK